MGVAVNTKTNRFYVPNGGANTVSVFDGTSNCTLATISVLPDGLQSTGIAVVSVTKPPGSVWMNTRSEDSPV
jgi:DNA-binding beta-propeller fold protein YncE